MQEALSAVVNTLAHYRATRALSDEEAPLLHSACTAMVDTLCPYIAKCFWQIFPSIGPGLIDLGKITTGLADQPGTEQLPTPAQLKHSELPVA